MGFCRPGQYSCSAVTCIILACSTLNEQLVPSTNPTGLFPEWGGHMPCDSGFWHAVQVPRILETQNLTLPPKYKKLMVCTQGQGGRTLEGQVSDILRSAPSCWSMIFCVFLIIPLSRRNSILIHSFLMCSWIFFAKLGPYYTFCQFFATQQCVNSISSSVFLSKQPELSLTASLYGKGYISFR